MKKAGRQIGQATFAGRSFVPQSSSSPARRICASLFFRVSVALMLCMSLTLSGCFLTNEVEPYYGRVTVPQAQEFRWSDGGLPQTFDPALAAAPPDTDAVRALFEGLTDYDPQTLAPVPGVASRWESSEDKREWTFHLRRDARWSNGDAVTAKDFVRSWQRTLSLGSRAPHAHLLENIVGAVPVEVTAPATQGQAETPVVPRAGNEKNETVKEAKKGTGEEKPALEFGVEAAGDYVLRVRLLRPDENFPSLVAHPIFRPVHDLRAEEGDTALAQPIVSNGPFRLTQVAHDGVILERASSYWDAQTVNLNRVRFVPASNAEEALERYRAGEVDAVTNAGFEPLALKLLAPYKDFRRATFGALTYYKFNMERAPFNDVRVREALAIAIDRARISDDEMDGASEPAQTFLPAQSTSASASSGDSTNALSLDIARAQSLLAEAGYPQGAGFPRVRLLVNRNDQQRQIAQSIAAMWRRSLGIETEVILKTWDEYEAALSAGEYDVVRKGIVMQTMDEAANMRAMFESEAAPEAVTDAGLVPGDAASPSPNGTSEKTAKGNGAENQLPGAQSRPPILSETEALKELPAIPVYFASSYALVKPYVNGFDANLLDAPSLKRVRMDASWQAPKKNSAVWFKVGE
jgi:oligopeptide transport system substrate-binding protein